MKIFLGLGNPGPKYVKTRHNAGFMWVDKFKDYLGNSSLYQVTNWRLVQKYEAYISEVRKVLVSDEQSSKVAFLMKPNTYMNNSGRSIYKFLKNNKIDVSSDLYVVHDDLDITLGKAKLQHARGPKAHKGLLSIRSLVGANYFHIRIGVDNRISMQKEVLDPDNYVLQKMSNSELEQLSVSIQESIGRLFTLIEL